METPQRKKLSILWYRIAQNIDQDYLEMFLITSQAAGLSPSAGRPMGAGKSTIGIWTAYRAFAYEKGLVSFDYEKGEIIDEATEEERIGLMKEIVEKYVCWTLTDLQRVIKSSPKRLPAVLWDDVQLDCPSWQHIPPKKREQIEDLTVARPLVANIIMTAPSISDIAKPLRRNITWEIIVPDRGLYEVHFLAKKRDFYNPTDDRSRLWYDVSGTFDKLPEEVYECYIKRRTEVAREEKGAFREVIPVTELTGLEKKVFDALKKGMPISIIARNLGIPKEEILQILAKT